MYEMKNKSITSLLISDSVQKNPKLEIHCLFVCFLANAVQEMPVTPVETVFRVQIDKRLYQLSNERNNTET
jgi:hypothetical protein